MTTAETARVARSYFAAWTSRQGPQALRALMAPEFVFDAGPQRIEGREAFLAAGGWPDHATTTMLAEAYDGDHAFQLYLGTNGHRQVKIAEHLVVRDQVIVSSEVVVDGSAFQAFFAG